MQAPKSAQMFAFVLNVLVAVIGLGLMFDPDKIIRIFAESPGLVFSFGLMVLLNAVYALALILKHLSTSSTASSSAI